MRFTTRLRDQLASLTATPERDHIASPEKPGYALSEPRWLDDKPGSLFVQARSAWATTRAKFLLITLALVAVVTAELVQLAARNYDKDYFFDEMWRADLVRTPTFVQRYLTNDAPAPPGWFFVLRLLGIALPNGPRALRLQNAVLDVLMFLLLALLLDRMLTLSRRRPVTRLVAPVSAVLVVLFPAYADLAQYLNDYMFQAASTIGVVVLWRMHDEWRYGRIALLASIVLLPLVTLSGLLLLPVVAAELLRRDFVTARGSALWRRLAGTVGAFVGSAGVALALYELLYRPAVDHDIRRYWADTTLSESSLGVVLRTSWRRLMDASISHAVNAFPNGYDRPVAVATVVCLAVAGLILLGRLWVWFPIAFVSAWAMAAAASLAGWPIAPERMNLPILWMFHTAVVVAVICGVARLMRHPALVVGTGAMLVWAFWPAPLPNDREPFARGLTSDLDIVAASPDTRNIVVNYHRMSHWYADDRLVTGYRGPDTFTIVREPLHDPAPLYDHPDDVVRAAGWRPGTAVWCVVPFEVGPEAGSRACRLGLPGLTKQVQTRKQRAYIIGWLPPPTALSVRSTEGEMLPEYVER